MSYSLRHGLRGNCHSPTLVPGTNEVNARAAILTLVLAAEGTAAHTEPNKEQYELQARCGIDRFEKRDPSAV